MRADLPALGRSLRAPTPRRCSSTHASPASDETPKRMTAPCLANEPSDHELVGQARGGDQDASTQLYGRYAKRVTALVKKRCSDRLARDAGVDDIVQSVFKTLFEQICHGCYDVPDGDELWKLLLVLALNKIRSKAEYYGARKRNGHANPDETPPQERVCMHIDVRVYATVQIEFLLNETLERLPPQHRLMVKLRVEGYKVDEIARMTGRSRRSAERILQETRARLLDLLREDA
jgi:RNA polymerase sigma-70 factor, ECF subfamily